MNHLKITNDLYGHQAGDAYLRKFSAILCNTFAHCPVFRIGGDEFAIIFEDLSEEAVLQCWQKLTQEFAEQHKNNGLLISAAFGYAFWQEGTLDTVEKI
ncbi:MAG: diguanylate cyclase, partial [Clostridiales bacterium]